MSISVQILKVKMKYNARNMYFSCLRKAKFKDKAKAEIRAKKYNQRIYYCGLCGYYHLTSKGVDNDNK